MLDIKRTEITDREMTHGHDKGDDKYDRIEITETETTE